MSGRGADDVVAMASAMANELESNRQKGDYSGISPEEAANEALYHCLKLALAMASEGDHRESVLEYAADTANCAMFCAISKGALDPGLLNSGHAEDRDPPWVGVLGGWKARIKDITASVFKDPKSGGAGWDRSLVAAVRNGLGLSL